MTEKKNKKRRKDLTETIPEHKVDIIENRISDNDAEAVSEHMYEILGSDRLTTTEKIFLLPNWMKEDVRTIVSGNIKSDSIAVKAYAHKNMFEKSMLKKLKQNGITAFFPVQAAAMPLLWPSNNKGGDICISAATGSGKTLAYVLPILHYASARNDQQIVAIVLTPTQQLAEQIDAVIGDYADDGVSRLLLSPTQNIETERDMIYESCADGSFKTKVHIIVSTIPRLIEHIYFVDFDKPQERPACLDLKQLRYLVIDEADRLMQDQRFDWMNEIERAVCSENVQKVLLSATLSRDPELLAQFRLRNPKLVCSDGVQINLDSNQLSNIYPPMLRQCEVSTSAALRPLAIHQLLNKHDINWKHALIFVDSRDDANKLKLLLTELSKSNNSYVTELCHGGMFANHRKKAVRRFVKSKERSVLIASDLVARGVDFDKIIELVINYSVPSQTVNYMHRVGRTARCGDKGTCVTITANDTESKKLKTIANAEISQIECNFSEEAKCHYKAAMNVLREHYNPILRKRKAAR